MVKKRKVDRYLKVHDYWHLGIVCVFFHFDRNIAVKKSDEWILDDWSESKNGDLEMIAFVCFHVSER